MSRPRRLRSLRAFMASVAFGNFARNSWASSLAIFFSVLLPSLMGRPLHIHQGDTVHEGTEDDLEHELAVDFRLHRLLTRLAVDKEHLAIKLQRHAAQVLLPLIFSRHCPLLV